MKTKAILKEKEENPVEELLDNTDLQIKLSLDDLKKGKVHSQLE